MMKKILWVLVVILAILISIIPFTYLIPSIPQGFLTMKDPLLLKNLVWKTGLYAHIFPGGVALLIGWVQFSEKLRQKRLQWHRVIGKIYVLSSLICSFAGVFIGFYADGGTIGRLGFVCVGVVFFYTTWKGYRHILRQEIVAHQRMMTLSYAACLGAVTLRLYMPFLIMYFGNYGQAYTAVAWLSWVPNVLLGLYLTRNMTPERRYKRQVV
jgi:uncharacterized membrane protein